MTEASGAARSGPAGDVDYEDGDRDYAGVRRPEPRFAAAIRAALGDVRTVVNVGAGAGSYEPGDLDVTPVEPSGSMRRQRPSWLAPAVDAAAEDLPFPDDHFDAALASFTVHQWRHLDRGLREVRRVTRGPVVVLTCDPAVLSRFWLAEYAPEMMANECGRMPEPDRLIEGLGGSGTVDVLPIPAECADGFAEAYFGRPEGLLEERVRRAQSAWSFVDRSVEDRSVGALADSVESGAWDAAHGALRSVSAYEGSLRLLTSFPD